jgi:hypothetical protein
MSKWENIPDLEKKKLEVSLKRFMMNEHRKNKTLKLILLMNDRK